MNSAFIMLKIHQSETSRKETTENVKQGWGTTHHKYFEGSE